MVDHGWLFKTGRSEYVCRLLFKSDVNSGGSCLFGCRLLILCCCRTRFWCGCSQRKSFQSVEPTRIVTDWGFLVSGTAVASDCYAATFLHRVSFEFAVQSNYIMITSDQNGNPQIIIYSISYGILLKESHAKLMFIRSKTGDHRCKKGLLSSSQCWWSAVVSTSSNYIPLQMAGNRWAPRNLEKGVNH